jgi:hypothetical protein
MICRRVRGLVPAGHTALAFLILVASCDGTGELPTGTDEGPVEKVSAPLRVRTETLLGNGPAGWRQTIEPGNLERLSGIQVRSGTLVDAIRFRYRDQGGGQWWAPWIGGLGGGAQTEFLMEPGEKLVRVDARTGNALDQVKFTTIGHPNGTRTYGPFGGNGGSPVFFETGSQSGERLEIHGFTGGSGGSTPENSLNWIRLISFFPSQVTGSINETEQHIGWGGNGGSAFSFAPNGDEFLKGVQIVKSAQFPGVGIAALRALFRSASTGAERWTAWAGNTANGCANGTCTTEGAFILNPGEFFTDIRGNSGDTVYQLEFATSTGRSYGPFGVTFAGRTFDFQTRIHGGLKRKILGLSGRSGQLLDRIEATSGYPSCGHLACVTGAKMVASCDPCVAQICAADSFCCNNSWDDACVREVASVCGLNCNTN